MKQALEWSTVKTGDSQGKCRKRLECLFCGASYTGTPSDIRVHLRTNGCGTGGKECGTFPGKPVKSEMKKRKVEVTDELNRRAKKERADAHDLECSSRDSLACVAPFVVACCSSRVPTIMMLRVVNCTPHAARRILPCIVQRAACIMQRASCAPNGAGWWYPAAARYPTAARYPSMVSDCSTVSHCGTVSCSGTVSHSGTLSHCGTLSHYGTVLDGRPSGCALGP